VAARSRPSVQHPPRTRARSSGRRPPGTGPDRPGGNGGADATLLESDERFKFLVAGVKDYAIILRDRSGAILS